MALYARSLYPGLRLGRQFVDLAKFKELLSFGFYRFVWMIADQLIYYTDSVVIGMFLGVADITYYAVKNQLIA